MPTPPADNEQRRHRRRAWRYGTFALVLALLVVGSATVARLDGGRDAGREPAPSEPAPQRDRPAEPPGSGSPSSRPAFQSHAMLYSCCMAAGVKRDLLAAAKRSGASLIRVDFEVNGIAKPRPGGGIAYDWSKTDETLALADAAGLDVLGVLTGTPDTLADCPAGTPPDRRPACPPRDPDAYARVARAIFAHTKGRVAAWELLNEPDLAKNFSAGPRAYGRLLGAVYATAKDVDPELRILNGGIASPGHARWLRRAVAGGARFDVASGHLRGPLGTLGGATARYRRLFASVLGRRPPLWITETGYPARPGPGQEDPAFRGSDAAQASYLRRALPAIRRAGAREVFVTLRDGPEFGPQSPYRWEGIAAFDGARVQHRRALETVRDLNRDGG